MYLLAFFSLLIALISGSPTLAARQSVTFGTIPPSPTPTACPVPTTPTAGTWMAAATNIAAIPSGLLTSCQLGCLANDYTCNSAAVDWVKAFQQRKDSIWTALCFDPLLTGGYFTSLVQECGQCLAVAQFLANKASPSAHPIPDILDFYNGLSAQLLNGIDAFCFNSTGDAEALEHFMCIGRDLTREFGVPVEFFNFTLVDAPELAWNGISPTPTNIGTPPLPTL